MVFHFVGTIEEKNFEQMDASSKEICEIRRCQTPTNVHFQIICKWLKIRIGIFTVGDDKFQMYGKWNKESHPIFLMQNENNFFKPILSLKN